MFAGSLGLCEKAMPILGQSEQLAGAGFLVRNGLHCDKSLASEVFHVGSHAIVAASIDKLLEILLRQSAKFSEFHHRCNFGVPQAVGSAAKFVNGASFRGRSS